MEEQMIKLIAGIIMFTRFIIPTILILLGIQGLTYQLSKKKINLVYVFLTLIAKIGG